MIKNWERTEKNIARKTDGKRTPGSGNSYMKGDISTTNLLIECKETSQDKMIIQIDWFANIFKQSRDREKTPCLALEFGDGERRYFIPWNEHPFPSTVGIEQDWRGRASIRMYSWEIEEGFTTQIGAIKWICINPYLLRTL